MNEKIRIEKDTMGEISLPADAYYGAQTQRAINNFPISNLRFERYFLRALGLIKKYAAVANEKFGYIDKNKASAIEKAANEVIDGLHDKHFPIDIFQTGSGTSTNMNANEVIARCAKKYITDPTISIHPNDDINFGQSSNDVIPTAIRIATSLALHEKWIPSFNTLLESLLKRVGELKNIVKTGRTHLMDAMPITMGQVFSGYHRQIQNHIESVKNKLQRLYELPLGGTAVGTGINTHPHFGSTVATMIAKDVSIPFIEAKNHFEAQATLDVPADMSAQLKVIAISLSKIANDFRWMNSGPYGGLSEIQLKAWQPGSSIMPGKVNPVIEESLLMVCAQVIGNDTTIQWAAGSGNFELNVMLPIVAYNLLQSVEIMANGARNFAEKSVDTFIVRQDNIKKIVYKNPILITSLNAIIGYEKAAYIAKKAYLENRNIIDVAMENCTLTRKELEKYLDPTNLTKGGMV